MSRRGSPFNYHPSNNVLGQRLSRQGQESNLDTQRNLQEASAALETAFDRIRQVRRNLLRFSETLPADGATPATTNRDEISPGHEALLLSGGPTEDERGEASNLSSITPSQPGLAIDNREMARLPNFSALVSPPSTGYNPPQYPYTTDIPALLQVPPVPSVVPPRFSRQVTFNNQQAASAETAATTHGLRVAAREANPNAQDMYRDRAVDFASLATDFDRRYAQIRAVATPNSLPLPPLDDFGQINTRRDGRRYRSTLPSPPLTFSTSTSSPRTGEVYRSHWQWDRYPAMPDPLSNLPVPDRSSRQNYLPRPMPIHREPSVRSTVMPMSGNIPIIPPPFPPSPNIRTRPPTENPYAVMSGMEIGGSHSAFDNPDWTSDQFISWLFPQEHAPSLVPRRDPQNPETIRITRTTEAGSSPPLPAGPRRRGWARLDPDGNEIPWDEEEALERSRTEYRLRVLHQSQDDLDPPEMHRGVYDGQVFHGSVLDSMLNIPSVMNGSRPREPRQQQQQQQQQRRRRGRRLSSSSPNFRPFYVDPLPVPLSTTKIEHVNMEDCYPDVVVPKYASFAGR